MILGFFRRILGRGSALQPRSAAAYEKARTKAASGNVLARRKLATRADIEPEILYFLAEDPDPVVRRAIAKNEAAPRHADLLLAGDVDGEVRTSLAQKIARLTPGITADERDKIRVMTHQILEILARDQMVRVREILSQTLKDVANAPPELIRRLAWDAELIVSGPVLEHSPVLTDEDLISIIKSEPIAGALRSISSRRNLAEPVADTIVATADEEAITALLANASAQIREETLDTLVEQAKDIVSWQKPLVRRPKLSQRATERLAEFVADNLLDTLAMRNDLPPDTIRKVKAEVHRRLKHGRPPVESGRKEKPDAASGHKNGDTSLAEAEKEAKALYKQGLLGVDIISSAINENRKAFVLAALSVRAELPVTVAGKIMENESLKGLVSLVWKAGLPLKTAVQLQRFLFSALPGDILGGGGGTGYPLSEEDMNWQIDFFRDMAGI